MAAAGAKVTALSGRHWFLRCGYAANRHCRRVGQRAFTRDAAIELQNVGFNRGVLLGTERRRAIRHRRGDVIEQVLGAAVSPRGR